ncbi:BsuPI-related putative proteinase inhibitor [Pleionea sp. CnH1-48]|uniref:BsuPI-related putative proteinase inhibitor n=1 Tax=Pleionea sp. CnH1-48 TaxID=2954494 RepID=UPI0020982A5D|nr:BsuPI-related putative proteinase inhibitor [Pleionea sp. CnH1-48]MCO7222964.1 BsuPI-related putative proteinase inhibitor [Pleionea sp. CnH1-48]
MKRLIASTFLTVASIATFANDYVTMQTSDVANFTSNRGNNIAVEISDEIGTSWKKYSNFLNHGERWVWASESSNRVYTLNESDVELFADFDAEPGATFDINWGACVRQVVIEQKGLSVTVKAGTFNDVVLMSFAGNCRDKGLTYAYFAPQVGVIEWEEMSIAGNIQYKMNSAEIAQVSYPQITGLTVATNISHEHVIYNSVDTIAANLTLTNHNSEDMALTFPSGQTFEIEIIDANDNVVSRWSRGKAFIQAFQSSTIKAGESATFGGNIELSDDNGQALESGNYRVRISIKGYHAAVFGMSQYVPYATEMPLYINHSN